METGSQLIFTALEEVKEERKGKNSDSNSVAGGEGREGREGREGESREEQLKKEKQGKVPTTEEEEDGKSGWKRPSLSRATSGRKSQRGSVVATSLFSAPMAEKEILTSSGKKLSKRRSTINMSSNKRRLSYTVGTPREVRLFFICF